MKKQNFEIYFLLALIGVMIFFAILLEKYKWHECKKVGHGIFYCIWNGILVGIKND